MKIYISGAIANDERAEEKFGAAEVELGKLFPEAEIVNPFIRGQVMKARWLAQRGRDPEAHEYLEACIPIIGTCTHYVRIDDGIPSKGADIEALCAAYAGLTRLRDIYIDLPGSMYECLECGFRGAVAKCHGKRRRLAVWEEAEE